MHVEVDRRRTPARFDPTSGLLTARPALPAGHHEIWIGVENRAHARAARVLHATSAGRKVSHRAPTR